MNVDYNADMARNKRANELSVAELRQLLIEKRRKVRQDRLERYRKTGRIVNLIENPDDPALEHLRVDAELVDETPSRWQELRQRGRRVFDGLLLLVEIGAVLLLGFVLFNGLDLVRSLNEEVVLAQVQPTFTATPLVMAAVLPSGHTPPTSPGGAQPNEAEIPEHLRPLVQSLASIPLPTPSPEQAIRIQIPSISVDASIVQGDGWEQLKKGVGQHIGSANPGQNGNLVLSAHNDIFGELFRHLDQLSPGDQFTVYSNQRAYTYQIMGWDIVEPTQVEVLAPTPNATATLISCYPYLVNDKRIVVKAELVEG